MCAPCECRPGRQLAPLRVRCMQDHWSLIGRTLGSTILPKIARGTPAGCHPRAGIAVPRWLRDAGGGARPEAEVGGERTERLQSAVEVSSGATGACHSAATGRLKAPTLARLVCTPPSDAWAMPGACSRCVGRPWVRVPPMTLKHLPAAPSCVFFFFAAAARSSGWRWHEPSSSHHVCCCVTRPLQRWTAAREL